MVQTSIILHLDQRSSVPALNPAPLQSATHTAATVLLKHVRWRPSAAHNQLMVAISFRTESNSSWTCPPSASQAPSPVIPHSVLSVSWPCCLFLRLGGTPSVEMLCSRCLRDPTSLLSGVSLRELLCHPIGNNFPTISHTL